MTYYKLINNNELIGIATSYDLRKYQKKHNIILTSNEQFAQYIQYNNKLYRDSWFAPIITDTIEYETVCIVSISEEEFDNLSFAIENNKEIPVDNKLDSTINEEPLVDPIEEITVEFIMSKKIAEMSSICSKTISAGLDIKLSDNKIHHFSLTTQDQLNLINIAVLIASGETFIPYHADGELCKFYSSKDIAKILSETTNFKTYHTSYFNSLKNYIKSINDIESISDITYGIQIPDEYMSDVLKNMI